jgi:hypothetical protein
MAESSGRTTAFNNRPGREYSVGILQINLFAYREYTTAQMHDPLQNARATLKNYRDEGLRACGAYNFEDFERLIHVPVFIPSEMNQPEFALVENVKENTFTLTVPGAAIEHDYPTVFSKHWT